QRMRSPIWRGSPLAMSLSQKKRRSNSWLAAMVLCVFGSTASSFMSRAGARPFAPDADRFDATLSKGVNRVVVQVTSVKGQTEFHVRFRKKSANHEPLIQAALSRTGDSERGRKLFLDVA